MTSPAFMKDGGPGGSGTRILRGPFGECGNRRQRFQINRLGLAARIDRPGDLFADGAQQGFAPLAERTALPWPAAITDATDALLQDPLPAGRVVVRDDDPPA